MKRRNSKLSKILHDNEETLVEYINRLEEEEFKKLQLKKEEKLLDNHIDSLEDDHDDKIALQDEEGLFDESNQDEI